MICLRVPSESSSYLWVWLSHHSHCTACCSSLCMQQISGKLLTNEYHCGSLAVDNFEYYMSPDPSARAWVCAPRQVHNRGVTLHAERVEMWLYQWQCRILYSLCVHAMAFFPYRCPSSQTQAQPMQPCIHITWHIACMVSLTMVAHGSVNISAIITTKS